MKRAQARLERDLHRRVGQILLEVGNPIIADALVTVSKAVISPDNRVLKIYVMVNLDPVGQEQVMDALAKLVPFVRGRLGENLELRHTPSLRFYLDDTPEKAMRIDAILDAVKKSSTAETPADPSVPAPGPDDDEPEAVESLPVADGLVVGKGA